MGEIARVRVVVSLISETKEVFYGQVAHVLFGVIQAGQSNRSWLEVIVT